MKHCWLVLVAACGASAPPPPISGTSEGPPETAPPAAVGNCEPDATQRLEAIQLGDGSRNPWRFVGRDKTPLATPYLYDNGADYFQEGFARIVDASGKVGFISAAGVIVIPPHYDFAYPFCHGLAKTALAGTAGYLDAKGQSAPGPASDDRPLIPPSSDD